MAIERLYDCAATSDDPQDLYERLVFADIPSDRPYVYANMVATLDGKTRLSARGTARGLGSATDQMLLRRLEANADGVIVGASTLRAGSVIYAANLWRFAVTSTGEIPLANRFFTDAPDRAVVLAPESLPEHAAAQIRRCAKLRLVGRNTLNIAQALWIARHEYGIERLALEGGGALNGSFLLAGLIDEFFLTLAPKLKGCSALPTPVDGEGLPGPDALGMTLVSVYRDGDELYLRYRACPRG